MGGFAHQRPGAVGQDQHRDQHRQDRVDRHPAGRQDDQRRDDRAAEPSRSPSTCRIAPRMLRLSRSPPCSTIEAGDVDQQAERRRPPASARRAPASAREALQRLVDDPQRDGEDGQAVGVGDQRLDPVEAIGEPRGRRRVRRDGRHTRQAPARSKSVSMWPASATSASDPVSKPPSASATMKPPVSAAAISTRVLSVEPCA